VPAHEFTFLRLSNFRELTVAHYDLGVYGDPVLAMHADLPPVHASPVHETSVLICAVHLDLTFQQLSSAMRTTSQKAENSSWCHRRLIEWP
jgi:hypothetical protein